MEHMISTVELPAALHSDHILGLSHNTAHTLVAHIIITDGTDLPVCQILAHRTGMNGPFRLQNSFREGLRILQRQPQHMKGKALGCFTAKAGGGMVSATVNGKHELVNLEINPEAVDPKDVEMLQDMVIAAVNEAIRSADNEAANNMSRLTGGLNLGGLC